MAPAEWLRHEPTVAMDSEGFGDLPEPLRQALDLRLLVASAIERERGLLGTFVDPGSPWVRRFAYHDGSDSGAHLPKDHAHDNITTTAFTLYMTLGPSRFSSLPTPLGFHASQSLDIEAAQRWLEDQLIDCYTTTRNTADSPSFASSTKRSDYDRLPNRYNTPLHVLGVLIARRTVTKRLLSRSTKTLQGRIRGCINLIAQWLQDDAGSERLFGNPYFMYWNFVAALEAIFAHETDDATLSFTAADYESLRKTVATARDHATQGLAELIAAHHSGIEGFSDATEFLFTLAVAALRSKDEHHDGSEDLVRHGTQVLFERYVTNEGSIFPRSTAFVDVHRTRVVISSAEHAALLLESLGPYVEPSLSKLSAVTRYLLGRRLGLHRWGCDDGHSIPQRPVFVGAAAVSFLQRFSAVMQNHIDTLVLGELGAKVEPPRASAARVILSPRLEELIEEEIHLPLMRGTPQLAAMSLILHGEPGTSKTTTAKKISSVLGWPLVQLDPSTFLKRGIKLLDAEVSRVFRLLGLLQDKVVMFDEFEDMILAREDEPDKGSRFLTAAMLPKLQEVREAGRIVFLIATNHPKSIDPAIKRHGRIDRFVETSYPDENGRQLIFDRLCEEEFSMATQSITLLSELGFPRAWSSVASHETHSAYLDQLKHETPLDQFSAPQIRAVLRRLGAKEAAGTAKIDARRVFDVIKEVAHHGEA